MKVLRRFLVAVIILAVAACMVHVPQAQAQNTYFTFSSTGASRGDLGGGLTNNFVYYYDPGNPLTDVVPSVTIAPKNTTMYANITGGLLYCSPMTSFSGLLPNEQFPGPLLGGSVTYNFNGKTLSQLIAYDTSGQSATSIAVNAGFNYNDGTAKQLTETFTITIITVSSAQQRPGLQPRGSEMTAGSQVSASATVATTSTAFAQAITINPPTNVAGQICYVNFNAVLFGVNNAASIVTGASVWLTSGMVAGENIVASGGVYTLYYIPSTTTRTITAAMSVNGLLTNITFTINPVGLSGGIIPGAIYAATSDSYFGASVRLDVTARKQFVTLSSYTTSYNPLVTLTFNLATLNSAGDRVSDLAAASVLLTNNTPNLIYASLQASGQVGVPDKLIVQYNPMALMDQLANVSISAGSSGSSVTTTIYFGTTNAMRNNPGVTNTGTGSSSSSGATGGWYTLYMDIPEKLYINEVYTFAPSLSRGTATTATEIVNPYYNGEYYILYGAGVASEYYPYSSSYNKVYYNSSWVDPLPGTAAVNAAGLNGALPAVTWNSIYKVQTSASGSTSSPTYSFSTTALKENATLTTQNNQANFLAKKPGTYYLTVTLPSAYALINGDASQSGYTFDSVTGLYYSLPVSTKTYALTFVDKPSDVNGASPGDIIEIEDGSSSPSSTAPAGAKIGKPLKSGITVTDGGGKVLGTLGMSDIVILDTVGSRYKIQYNGGEGYVPKSLVNKTDIDASSGSGGGETAGLNIQRWISLRAQPSETATRVRKLLAGETVALLGDAESGWTHVRAGGDEGYIPTMYIKK